MRKTRAPTVHDPIERPAGRYVTPSDGPVAVSETSPGVACLPDRDHVRLMTERAFQEAQDGRRRGEDPTFDAAFRRAPLLPPHLGERGTGITGSAARLRRKLSRGLPITLVAIGASNTVRGGVLCSFRARRLAHSPFHKAAVLVSPPFRLLREHAELQVQPVPVCVPRPEGRHAEWVAGAALRGHQHHLASSRAPACQQWHDGHGARRVRPLPQHLRP